MSGCFFKAQKSSKSLSLNLNIRSKPTCSGSARRLRVRGLESVTGKTQETSQTSLLFFYYYKDKGRDMTSLTAVNLNSLFFICSYCNKSGLGFNKGVKKIQDPSLSGREAC